MSKPSTKRPNFLIIVADDLGFSDLGCFGGEIRTPNLDRLAKEGVRFTEFHTASMCSPTRSMIMSGNDHHIAGVGAMVEESKMPFGERWRGKPGYEGYLVDSIAALPEVLRDAGYHTIMSGKWHLGQTLDQIPGARGFDRSFGLLGALHNHYAWEPQWEKGNKYDDWLGQWHRPWYTKNNSYSRDKSYDNTIEANFPKRQGGFYSTKTFTDQLLEYMQERQADLELKEKPMFAYYAFSAPHYPLQAEKEDRDRYKGMYDDGPEALRLKRLSNLKKMGLIPEGVEAHELVDIWGKGDWESFSVEEKAQSCRAMEVYAAMVDVIDQNIGRVVKQLENDGELDNTFILFMSDNGAEGASYECIPILGPFFSEIIDRHYNNELDNIGEPDSFVWYGSAWAQASTAPSRLFKAWTSQGGIRVPCIVRYPPMAANPLLKAGNPVGEFQTCMDIMPTLLDLAGAQHPAASGKPADFHGRQVIPMRGKSWNKWFNGSVEHIHDTIAIPQGWELHGRAAIRKGDYKMIFLPPPGGNGDWELFNLKSDPGETKDLAKDQPEKLNEMLEAWNSWMEDTNVIWRADNPYDGKQGGALQEEEEDATNDPRNWMKTKKS